MILIPMGTLSGFISNANQISKEEQKLKLILLTFIKVNPYINMVSRY